RGRAAGGAVPRGGRRGPWRDATLVEIEANRRAAVLIEREGAPDARLTVDASRRGIDRDLLGDEPGQAHGDRPVFTSDEALTLSRLPRHEAVRRGPWLCTGRGTPAASVPRDRPLLVTRREEEYERGTCVFSAARCHPSTCCRPEGDVVDDQTSL